MPNTTSAKKALRQNAKRRLLNRSQRSSLRTTLKQTRTTMAGTDASATEAALRTASKKLDQAASKGLIHKKKAARLKSRLARAAKPATSGEGAS